MRKKYFIYLIFFIFLNLLLVNFSYAYTDDNGIGVNLQVTNCNNDNICDLNEDFIYCPLDCQPPAPTPTSGSTSGSYIPDFFKNLTVIPSYTTANIKWNSNFPTIYIIKWGRTAEYKDGVLKNVHFVYDHGVDITNLETGTTYYFSIESENYTGFKQTINNKSFKTLIPVDKVAPLNVTNAKISTTREGVVLSWTNPDDKDFSYVRIVRNDYKYSSDPYEGKLSYEGSGQYMRDMNVEKDQKYFYTIFTRDRSGNFSSGYPISIIHNPPVDGVVKIDEEVPTAPVESVVIDVNYIIMQKERKQDFNLGGTYDIDGDSSFKIIAKYNTEDTNENWIEVRDMDRVVVGRYFFGKYDSEFATREVTVPRIGGNGYYSISIFRYLDGVEQLVHQGGINVKTNPREELRTIPWLCIIIFGIILFLLLFIIFIVWRRRKKKKEVLEDQNTFKT